MNVHSLRRRTCVSIAALVSAVVVAHPVPKVSAAECNAGSFSSTFEGIEKVIFQGRGCADSICHGAALSGGLDLRPGAAYDSLVYVDATTAPGYKRVLPGQKNDSLLWINLAAKTLPDQYTAPLRPMPLDPLPALTPMELEAMRLWIERGAPRDGVIPGTADLLDACLPPPEPITIEPLPPPLPGTGLQFRLPPWTLPAHSERETCFASYYDVTDQVPLEYRGPDGTTFRYKRNDILQSPASHHLIVNLYQGTAAPDDPAWGQFFCDGGERDQEPCDPLDLGFCGEGLCATTPVNSIACIGFGPGDSGLGINSVGFSGTQETESSFAFPEGVYRELPLKGMIMWNHHAFNLTDTPGKLEAWLNFDFATPDEQQSPSLQIFDTSQIFAMRVPAFGTDEVCNVHQLPQDAHLFEISAHGHSHMKRWRTFIGAYRCDGGSRTGEPCSPFGADLDSPEFCPGARCVSLTQPRVGDCNFDHEVTVNELIAAINIALGATSIDSCREADVNEDETITINEVLTAVNAGLDGVPEPVERDLEKSFVYLSLIYNDPVVQRFDPPIVFSRPDPDERALTYCALYDNGYTNPDEVKRKSTSITPPIPIGGVGGPCQQASNCTAGQVEAACVGGTQAARDASCDSSPGAGDGVCDACTLLGGVTTTDEMFLLLGQYYVP